MRRIFVSILLVMYAANKAAADDVGEYKKLFMESMSTSVKCHPGFKKIPDRLVEAAEACAKQSEINNYMCYLTCMYRHYNYIKPGTNEIDFTIADIVTMEAFDLETTEGRNSYWDIALHRYQCGRDYAATKTAFFATKFDNAKDCSRARTFFKCQVLKTLFCGVKNDKVSAELERHITA